MAVSPAAGSFAAESRLGYLAGDRPKRPFDPIIFARWRAWKEYGTGVAGDLLVHLISGMMFMTGSNQPPTQAMSVGGIRRWKDGRNMPDVHAVLYYYGTSPSPCGSTSVPRCRRRIASRDRRGMLEVTSSTVTFTPQTGMDGPELLRLQLPEGDARRVREEMARGERSKSGRRPMSESVTFRGPEFDDVKPHLWNFFEAVRTRQPVVEDAVFGHNAALACHMANESYFKRRRCVGVTG